MYNFASSVAVAAVTPKLVGTPWYSGLLFGLAAYLLQGGGKWLRVIWRTLGRDLYIISRFIRVELFAKKLVKNKITIGDILVQKAKEYPNKKAYIQAETNFSLTFKEANELSNKVANFFYEKGFRKGDVIALIMENRVEYGPFWIGLSKIGVITALINTNLRGDSLKHCIANGEAKAVVFTELYEEVVADIHDKEKEYFCFDKDSSQDWITSFQPLLDIASQMEPPRCENTILDKMVYIYTSGTTGLPKAAVIRGIRFIFMSKGVSECIRISEKDIAYNTLPLYHTNGGVALLGSSLLSGVTYVTRKKFSASKFFEDCCKYECTVFNYIGEICRYLLAQPVREFDKGHKIRICTGNGLRASIWKEFQERFNIPLVAEFYGATEGNASMCNLYGKPGAVGIGTRLFNFLFPLKLVKVDEETGQILRGKDGLAIETEIGEPGVLCAKISKTNATKQFDGYVSKSATQSKIVCDIFSKGDMAFNTGDVLVQDEDAYFYFQDRTGDTFRWKGENVSTNEVEGKISKILDLNDVCVYGVDVPGIEGKAGMACIADPERKINLDDFWKKISEELPTYARPIFLRLTSEIAKTGTFKFKKTKLRREAFNPSECARDEDIHYFDPKERKYLLLDQKAYENIMNHQIRF